ncbi:hypothetical protein RN001_013755 [Aquatica leii]|uniref:Uncharacterized protein n=1 Tax=Aquatica leii TaxID=1421715 RepID=A0AAN7SNV1_9COLE|nr:hypothetical protein RN001_013755 [Aquatica leii]
MTYFDSSSQGTMMDIKPKKYFRLERLCLQHGGVSIDGFNGWMYRIYSTIVLMFFVGLYPILLLIDLIKQDNFNEVVAGWFYGLGIVMEALKLMEQHIQAKMSLELSMCDGETYLAKSRYIMGQNQVSFLQLPTEDSPEFEAIARVHTDDDDNTYGQKLIHLNGLVC